MALIQCRECGHEVSSKAAFCTHCGAPPLSPNELPAEQKESDGEEVIQIDESETKSIEKATKYPKHRTWDVVVVLVLAALIAIPFIPEFPLWFGIILLALCAGAFVKTMADLLRLSEKVDNTTIAGKIIFHTEAILFFIQKVASKLLRLNPGEKWRNGFRITLYGFIGLVLVILGWAGTEYKIQQEQIAMEQAAEQAKQRRLANEANLKVKAIVKEAEEAWANGDSALTEDKLEAASKIPNATDLAPVRQLRTRMANAIVKSLVAEAINALKNSDIDVAKEKVEDALKVPHANLLEAKKLNQQIGNATNPSWIQNILMELPDDAFQAIQGGEIPNQFVFDYEVLSIHAKELLKNQIGEVTVMREQWKQKQLELERAARKAEEERKVRELAVKEEALYAEVLKVPATDYKKNRDMYKQLMELNPKKLLYAEKYEFYQDKINTEMKKLEEEKQENKKRISKFGSQPVASAWDGTYYEVKKYLKEIANDPESIKVRGCTKVFYTKIGWLVGCDYTGKNAFGGTIRQFNWFTIINGNVVLMHEASAYQL